MGLLELIAEGQSPKLKRRKAEAEMALAQGEMAKLNKLKLEEQLAVMNLRQKMWKEMGEPKVKDFLTKAEEAEASAAENQTMTNSLEGQSSQAMASAIPPAKPAPELTTLLASMAPVLMQMAGAGGDVKELESVGNFVSSGESLSKAKFINDYLKSRVKMTPGAVGQASSSAGDLAANIEAAGRGDAGAIASIDTENTMRKLAGLDTLAPQLVALAKPDIDPRSIKDPETGEKITAAFDKKKSDYVRDKNGKVKRYALEDFPEYEQVKIKTSQGEFTQFVLKKDIGRLAGAGVQTAPPGITWKPGEGAGGAGNLTAVPEFAPPGTVVPTSPEKGESPEKSGKFTLAKMGIDSVNKLVKLIIKPDGTIDRKAVAKYQAPIPIGEGRDIDSNIRAAIESPIRAASGAALSKEDLATYKAMYGPSVLDSDELIIDKLERLHEFNVGYQKQIDPTGSMTKRLGEKPTIPRPKKAQDFVKTATNPQTGKKVGLTKDGKWIPIK